MGAVASFDHPSPEDLWPPSTRSSSRPPFSSTSIQGLLALATFTVGLVAAWFVATG
jgi:hypothetical protein